MTAMTSSWRSSGMSRMPNASVAVRRSRVMTPWEKYGGTASSRRRDLRPRGRAAAAEEVGQRERRAQLGLAAAALVAVAEALEQPVLVARHPPHDGRVGELVARDHDVDLAADAGRLLQGLEVGQRAVAAARAAGGRTRRGCCVSSAQPSAATTSPRARTRPGCAAAARTAPRPAAPARAQRPRRAVARDEVAGAAQRGAGEVARAADGGRERTEPRPAAPRRRGRARLGRGQHRDPERQRAHERDRDAGHEQQAEAADHRHRRQREHEEARGRRGRGRRDRRRAARRRPVDRLGDRLARPRLLLHPRLQLDRVVDREADEDRQHADRGHRQRRAEQRQAAEGQPPPPRARRAAAAAAAASGTPPRA